jgi:hypothetical protein
MGGNDWWTFVDSRHSRAEVLANSALNQPGLTDDDQSWLAEQYRTAGVPVPPRGAIVRRDGSTP